MEISTEKVKEWMDKGKQVHFLDVRSNEERTIAHIGGTHIPLDELEARFHELSHQNKPLVVYCHHGVRSLYATQFLKFHGHDALSLRGGIEEWSTKIDPNIQRY